MKTDALHSQTQLESSDVAHSKATPHTQGQNSNTTLIHEWVAHAAHYLPAQGPITAFVHHNTLHAFEHLPFDQAVKEAGALYGCKPFLNEEQYRAKLERGRIQAEDLEFVLQDSLGSRANDMLAGLVKRYDLCQVMLLDTIQFASEAEIQWVIAAGDGMRSFQRRCTSWLRRQMVSDTRQWVMRDLRGERQTDPHLKKMSADVLARWREDRIESWSPAIWEEVTLTLLWRVCRRGTHGLPRFEKEARPPLRLRDLILAVYGQDPDVLVHETLIRFCSAFTDQGLANWNLPQREQGFFHSFLSLYGEGYPARDQWMRGLPQELNRIQQLKLTPEDVILESLTAFDVSPAEQQDFITQSLLALRGWAGMLWQLETRPDRVRDAAPAGTLVEFLAIRLLLERLVIHYISQQVLGKTESLATLRQNLAKQFHSTDSAHSQQESPIQRAFVLFQLAQSLGWSPQRLVGLTHAQWEELVREIESFSAFERRRLFHLAYERHYRNQVFDALALHVPNPPAEPGARPSMQVLFCIDEREESVRRHLEELEPTAETLALAGFFGVPMYFQGVLEAHEMPLCPVIIRPVHRIVEKAVQDDQLSHERGASMLRRVGLAARQFNIGSHGFVLGMITTLLGSVAAIPLVARVLFPRMTSQFRKKAGLLVKSPIRTELTLERQAASPVETDGIYTGFLPEEMAQIVEAQLRNLGLTTHFSQIVVAVGHGSSSLNNPHEAAHDCGACGGGRGGPNARTFAQMANHPVVRSSLAAAGLNIPTDTIFIGAYHNTCDDSMLYYDTEQIPASHQAAFKHACDVIQDACNHSAHERSRRFRSAGLLISPEEALRHVEARSEDLSQPRPEYGHASNAFCVVARRSRSRDLFMDRRAFLVSYDPTSDDEDITSPILTRILQAVIPVCAGISLEYYFSNVDPAGWGCGTKLPHNITSLLGVMDGAASDLRPGLPWQMVEIHEPVRITFIVETTPERMLGLLSRNPAIDQLCRNNWIWLATQDPDSPQIHLYQAGEFVPYQVQADSLPTAESSLHWYGGLREHLEFASIRPIHKRQQEAK